MSDHPDEDRMLSCKPFSVIKKSYGYRVPLRVLQSKESRYCFVVEGNQFKILETDLTFTITEINGEKYVLGQRYKVSKHRPLPLNVSGGSLLSPNVSSGSLLSPNVSGGSLLSPNVCGGSLLSPNVSGGSLLSPNVCGGSVLSPINEDLQKLCQLVPSLNNYDGGTFNVGEKSKFYNFFHGIAAGESRSSYVFSLAQKFGGDNFYDALIPIPSDSSVLYTFSDGMPAVGIFRSAMPAKLSDHYLRIAQSVTPQMKNCQTRRVHTLHIGAKEYNPNPDQLHFYNGERRVWTMDKGNSKEQTVLFLPELEFADKFLQNYFKQSYEEKIEQVDNCYRIARTCFTRAAVNFGECQLHNDSCLGIDVLIYTGEMDWW